VAARLLARVERGGFADRLLEATLPTVGDPRDRALLTELVYGTLRRQGRLDHVLSHFARRPLRALHPEARAALRLSAYQLLELDRIPAHAAVGEAVEHVKRVAPGAAGFANALLRRVATEGRDVPLPVDEIDRLAVETSHPRWMVEREVAARGAVEARRRLLADTSPAPLVLRAREETGRLLARLADAGVAARRGRVAPEALVIEPGSLPPGGVAALPGFAEGAFAVQDEASQLVARVVDPPDGARVLDLCAAPGGKTGHLADLVGPQGHVVALDLDPARLARVRETVARLGVGDRVTVAAHDATRPLEGPLAGPYDAVLVDAPCSGLGVIRRNPDILWRRRPEDIAPLAASQRAILDVAAGAVRPGGRLVYSVCTTTAEEGPGVVDAFLAAHADYEAEDRVVTHPADGGLDGFFVQRMRRVVTVTGRGGDHGERRDEDGGAPDRHERLRGEAVGDGTVPRGGGDPGVVGSQRAHQGRDAPRRGRRLPGARARPLSWQGDGRSERGGGADGRAQGRCRVT
jgi:16S rRNA (cytosine967-C5)-methyltransferase